MSKNAQIYENIEYLRQAFGIPRKVMVEYLSDPDTDKEKLPKRKRGGQPGNQNARKHGFYSKHFTAEQWKQFQDANDLSGLSPEIALIRVKLNTLLDDPGTSPELILKTVNALTKLMSVQKRHTSR